MAWNLSTGAKNALLGLSSRVEVAMTDTDISFDTTSNTIEQVAAQFVVEGFDDYPYYTISVIGSTSNDGNYRISTVAAGVITVDEDFGDSISTEAAGDQVILVVSKGGAFSEIFANSILHLFNASRPASADLTESGTVLVKMTKGGGAFVSGAPANGLNFGDAASGAMGLADDPATGVDQVVSGEGLVTGSALGARLYENTVTTGASTTSARADGRVGVSNSEVNMSAGTSITAGVDADVTSVSFTA